MNPNTFIKVPNSIIGNIKGANCPVYLYLLYLCTVQHSCRVKVKYQTIKNNTEVKHIETVCNIAHRLQKQSYLKIKNNHNPITGYQTCNTITVLDYDPQQNYFLFPSEYLFADLPSYALELLLTLYMFSFQDSFSIPSFTQISRVSRLSPASIVKGYRILEEKGIIVKENYNRRDGSKGHNRYFLIKKIERFVGEERAVHFLAWIKRQKQICYELWQIIKEVLMGNTHILEEICAQEYAFADIMQCTDNEAALPIANEPIHEGENNCSIWGFARQKFSRIRSGIRQFCAKFFRKIVGVLLEN